MHGHGMNLPKNFVFNSGFFPFKDFNVEYIDQPYQTFINPKNGSINYNYFEPYKNRLIVINFSSEQWNNFEDWVCEQLLQTDLNFLLLTYDADKHQKYSRMFYYPYWYQNSKEFWAPRYPNCISVNKNKNYYLGCFNGNARTHRIANFLKLKKQPYWNKICVSFHSELSSRPDEFELLDNEITEWEQIQPTLSQKTKQFASDKYVDVNSAQLVDSYLHLVTETTVLPSVYISEKTWKPVSTAVPFVVWGNPGTMNLLKRLGVDTYDDVIDHKYYDAEKDARLRLDKLHEVIDDLVSQGVDKIYNQLFDRSIDNQKKYFQGDFGQNYHNMIVDAIKKYS